MSVSRFHPRSFDDLSTIVKNASKYSKSVVMQSGHFLLYYDTVEDCLLPCISSELTSPRHELLRLEAGGFPLLTWQLGLELLDRLSSTLRQIMIVVNDWQYLPKNIDRRRFYENYRELPSEYSETLSGYNGRLHLLEPDRGTGTQPFFGEMNLRNQYRKTVETLINRGDLPANSILERNSDRIVCSLSDAVGRTQEVYCSNKTGDCAGEIAQMLRLAVKQASCDCFINIYPAVCRDFVEQGTELGENLLRNGIPNVINIGFPTSGIQVRDDLFTACEITWHCFKNESALAVG